MKKLIKNLFGRKENAEVDKKEWIIKNVSSCKNGRFKYILNMLKSCDSNTKREIIKESAYLPISEGLIKLLAYLSHYDPHEGVKRYARSIVDSRSNLRFQVLQIQDSINF